MLPMRAHLKDLVRVQNVAASRQGHLRLDKNENLVDLPEDVIEVLRNAITAEFVSAYPELDPLYERVARSIGQQRSNVFLVAGSDQAIKASFEVFVDPGDTVVLLSPTYAMFPVYCGMFQARRVDIRYPASLRLTAEDVLRPIVDLKPKLACIANPNSPTSTVLPHEALREIVRTADRQGTVILIDEAYHHYYPQTVINMIRECRHLVVTRTFSKALGLAAARVGFAAGHEQMIQALHRVRPMYEINAFGAKFAELILDRPWILESNVRAACEGKAWLEAELTRLGIRFVPSHANFMLIDAGGQERSKAIAQALQAKKILIGGGFEPPLDPFIRASIGPVEAMRRFLEAFASEALAAPPVVEERQN